MEQHHTAHAALAWTGSFLGALALSLPLAQSTVMSILCGVASQDESARRLHLERFSHQYFQPLVDYLRFARNVPIQDAEDLVQEFWTVKLLSPPPTENLISKYLTRQAVGAQAGFRHYLCRSLRNFVIDNARRWQRTGEALSLQAIEGWEPQSEQSDESFDVVWATHILNDVVAQVRQSCCQTGQINAWQLFVQYTLQEEALDRPLSMADMAQLHGFPTAKQASNALQTMSRRFRRVLRDRIADYLPTSEPDDVDDLIHQEAAELLSILAKTNHLSAEVLLGIQDSAGQQALTPQQQQKLAASFRLTGSALAEVDFGALWLSLQATPVDRWLTDAGCSCRPEWHGITFADLLEQRQINLDLLEAIRSTAKSLAAQAKEEQEGVHGTDYPVEILAVLYLTTIALARLQHAAVITSTSDSALSQRVQDVLQYPWIDQQSEKLLREFLMILR